MPTLTDAESAGAIREHHAELRDTLRERVAALRHAVQAGRPHEPAQRAVLTFLDTELLPHAAAEERSIYPAGDRHHARGRPSQGRPGRDRARRSAAFEVGGQGGMVWV